MATTGTITRTAVYARISKDDPKKKDKQPPVARQKRLCEKLAQEKGWTVVATYEDEDISAYSGKERKGFEALLKGMEAGEFTVVMAWHVDRLYRNMKDLERVIEVADAAGITFKTVNSGELDLSTSAGKMVARILGSVARQESEHHSERRREANLDRATAGAWCGTGNRTFGYRTVGPERGKRGEVVDHEAEMLRDAADRVLANEHLASIAREWNAKGHTTTKGAKWTNLHLRRVLMNPRIAGQLVHQGKVIGDGKWKPIIEPTTWRGVMAVLNDPVRRTGGAWERQYMLSGIARCGVCGGKLYAAYPHGKARGFVYTCKSVKNAETGEKGSHVGRLGQPLDDHVAVTVLEWLSRPDAQLRLGTEGVDVNELQTRRAALVAEKDQLGTLFGRHVIDAVQLENGSIELRGQIAEIDRKLADTVRVSPASTLAAQQDRLYDAWEELTPAMRAQVIDEVAVVTVRPTGSGKRGFDPDDVDVDFRVDS
jgi:site-specific DNA recombinase